MYECINICCFRYSARNLCVYMYIHICLYYIYTYECINMCSTHIHIYVYCNNAQVRLRTCCFEVIFQKSMCLYIYTYMCTYTYMYLYIYVYMYIYIYIYTYIHIHTYNSIYVHIDPCIYIFMSLYGHINIFMTYITMYHMHKSQLAFRFTTQNYFS